MPAFTHLCKKFNISLAHNTLTLYPKKTVEKVPTLMIDQCFRLIVRLVDGEYNLDSLQISAFDEVGRPTFVHRDDVDHYLYHDDNFNMDNTHYHIKFKRQLDEPTLDKIFGSFPFKGAALITHRAP
ncbi:MAG: hypothetical protein ACRCXC_10670 [Legionella sp.]